MHPDLSAHLHTDECNILIKKLQECHSEKTYGKFFGACNSFDHDVWRCLKQERIDRRTRNAEEGRKRRERIKALVQKENL